MDDDGTLEGELGQVGFESQVIVPGYDIGREKHPASDIGRAGGLSCAGVSTHVVSSAGAVSNECFVDERSSSITVCFEGAFGSRVDDRVEALVQGWEGDAVVSKSQVSVFVPRGCAQRMCCCGAVEGHLGQKLSLRIA